MNPTQEVKTYPHLTQTSGVWELVHLPEWTPIPNKYIPIKIPRFLPLDRKIGTHMQLEYQRLLQRPDECIITSRSQKAIRTPYVDTIDVFTIVYSRALLSLQFEFSYHNWLEYCPPGTILGRVCGTRSCRNPRHHEMGVRPYTTAGSLAIERHESYRDQLEVVPPDYIKPFIELDGSLQEVILECMKAGDTFEQAMSQARRVADAACGQLPMPTSFGYANLEEMVQTLVKLYYKQGTPAAPTTRAGNVVDTDWIMKNILNRDIPK